MATASTSNASSTTTDGTLHIVFVHGFKGDHTSFQAFPSDLHYQLLPDIPGLQTWVYPTYKSAKPLSVAVENLLRWLDTLDPGSIILAGHSMGGLLVAEAAITPSPVSKRIVGMIGLDAPYLGMHPHVVVSGIASLFVKNDKKKKDQGDMKQEEKKPEDKKPVEGSPIPAPSAQGMPTEKSVNDLDKVTFVSRADAFQGGDKPAPKLAVNPANIHITVPPPRPSLSPTSTTSGSSETSSFRNQASSFFQKYADDPFIRFLNKHSDAPVQAMSRWVVEYFEFGFAMFDYPELVERYKKLEKWDGDWVNYWTVTAGDEDEEDKEMEDGRPPTPRKIRLAKHGHTGVGIGASYESEFEKAMRRAVEQNQKRQGKDARKREEESKKREEEMKKKAEKEEIERDKKEEKQEVEKLKKDQGTFLKKELEAERDRSRRLEREEKERKSKEEARKSEDPKSHIREQFNDSKKEEPTTSAITSLPDVIIEPDSSEASSPVQQKDSKPNKLVKKPHSRTGSTQSLSPSGSHSPGSGSSRPPSPSPNDAHHFITLPGSFHEMSRKRWLKVRIGGVEDEVAAHCGIFIRGQNLEYQMFVERVGELVKSWVL